MRAAQASDVGGNDLVLYSLYQSLPVGAAFLSSERKAFAANRKMCAYFPSLSDSREQGLLICKAVRCPDFLNGTDPRGRPCKDCVFFRGIAEIICENKPMQEVKWRYDCLCGSRRLVRWFYVSGIPVSFCGRLHAVLFFRDATHLVLKEAILRKKLRLDQQTKVLNKVSLLHSLEGMLRTDREEPVTICMVDFDNFKTINDRYGHLMGDRVLDTFCRIARKNIRAGDALGRYGGEEFLFIFRSEQEQAASILRRIQSDLRKAFFSVFTLPVTFSAGVVSCGRTPRGWEELVKEADRLLYRAKAGGKNQIVQGMDREQSEM